MPKDSTSILLSLFADLLKYPSADTKQQAVQCLEQLQSIHPSAVEMMQKFTNAFEKFSLDQMQEIFTTTFDMQPVCYPYVGFHLYGESYKRGAFMAQLNEAYRGFDYSSEQELPDNLAVILRFLSLDADNFSGEFCQALLNDGVQPALEKMLKVFAENSEHPYFGLLSALRLFLVYISEKELTHA